MNVMLRAMRGGEAMRGLLQFVILSLTSLACSVGAHAADPQGATPRGNPGDWITGRDYPVGVANRGGIGLTAFKLTIGSDGAVANCEITQSSGSQILDNKTCELIKARASFTPARDRQGKGVVGTYSNRVRWTIPGDERVARLGTIVKTVTVDLDKSGLIRKCEFTNSATDARDAGGADTPCSPFREGAEFAIVQDANGKEVEARMIVETTVRFVPR